VSQIAAPRLQLKLRSSQIESRCSSWRYRDSNSSCGIANYYAATLDDTPQLEMESRSTIPSCGVLGRDTAISDEVAAKYLELRCSSWRRRNSIRSRGIAIGVAVSQLPAPRHEMELR
jgi:hypothetical protein